jgi:hypothetical protein
MLTTDQLDELDRLKAEVKRAITWKDQIEAAADWQAASRNALPELLAMARQLLRANEYIEVLEASNRALLDGREEWARRCREMAKNQ